MRNTRTGMQRLILGLFVISGCRASYVAEAPELEDEDELVGARGQVGDVGAEPDVELERGKVVVGRPGTRRRVVWVLSGSRWGCGGSGRGGAATARRRWPGARRGLA